MTDIDTSAEEKLLNDFFGPRCGDFEPECAGCVAWRAFDTMRAECDALQKRVADLENDTSVAANYPQTLDERAPHIFGCIETVDVEYDFNSAAFAKGELRDIFAAFDAMRAERDALQKRVAELAVALRPCLAMLDALVEESGKSVEYGAEDAFRSGEWFEAEDVAAIATARAALSGEAG